MGVLLALLAALLLVVACGETADVAPFDNLPPAPELPDDAVLYYGVVEGSPMTVHEGIILYQDGTISYADGLYGTQGEQFMGPGGVEQLLDSLQNAGFWDLNATYRPRKGETPLERYVSLAARGEKGIHMVQWQDPAIPAALADIAADLAQFAEVVKMTIR